MIDAETRAKILIEALPYIQEFRAATIVIKYGGSAMENETLVELTLRDIVLLEAVGINPVIVHGGGKAITRALDESGIEAKFVQGLRITSAEAVKVVNKVLDNEVNPAIVTRLEFLGGWARGISGTKVFTAKPQEPLLLPDNTKVDLGFVGDITRVETDFIRSCLEHQTIPVISPLGSDANGQVYNINADIAAMELAIALQAEKLIYLSDVPGVLSDPRDQTTVIPSIKSSEVNDLLERGVISGGMIPKIQSAVTSIQKGVGKVQFIDGRTPHSLLLEIFTDAGIGTEIIP
jgi:acetylglutamate kinase